MQLADCVTHSCYTLVSITFCNHHVLHLLVTWIDVAVGFPMTLPPPWRRGRWGQLPDLILRSAQIWCKIGSNWIEGHARVDYQELCWLLLAHQWVVYCAYCKTHVFHVPFISRPWPCSKNKGSWIFEISCYFSVLLSPASKNAKIKGIKIM